MYDLCKRYPENPVIASASIFIGTVRIVSGEVSTKRYGVRPSVSPSACPRMTGPQQQTHCCRFAAVARRAGDIDPLLQQRRANAGSATLSAYVGS